MHIRLLPNSRTTGLLVTLFLLSAAFLPASGQTVWENPSHPVYDFLSRQAQKGLIEFDDFQRPLSRKEIAAKLADLQSNIGEVSATDQQELLFHRREFAEFDPAPDSTAVLKKDESGRFRFLSIRKDGFLLKADPSLSVRAVAGKDIRTFHKGNGLRLWGHAGNNFSFQAYFQDITERGSGLDTTRSFTPDQGVVRTQQNTSAGVLNYSDLRGNLTYSWSNGSVSFGKDQLYWGYGENGTLVLSGKAPAYPFIRLDYQPLKWLRFNYAHAWLQSGIIDSASIYNKGNTVYGPNRDLYIPKFMATHSLHFLPARGLVLSMGESVVYSDRLDVGFLIPVMFFKAYDHYSSRYNITGGSNGQFFFQASSRNHIRKTHLYSTLFVDEIRLSAIFNNQKRRNQIGFNFGASVTDLFVSTLTAGMEYTRSNPFIYRNLVPAQDYSNHNYPLGDWMGSNADRIIAFVKYTPLPRLKTTVHIQTVRKGTPPSLEEQYFSEPQPPFMESVQLKASQARFRISYEWINNLVTEGELISGYENNFVSGGKRNFTQLAIGFRYGF